MLGLWRVSLGGVKGQLVSNGLFGAIILTKNQRIFLRISALAYQKSSNQKTLSYDNVR